MYDFCAIGDALIDYIPGPGYTLEKPIYQCEVGGTVVNALTAASKLGLHTMFIGKIGDDCMGELIRRKMESYGVGLEGCVLDPVHFTTQSFVTLDENGERSFSFSRRFGADIWLDEKEIPIERVLQSAMVGFSGMCMTDEPVRTATWKVLNEAHKKGIPIVLDVNYRHNLWSSKEKMICEMKKTLSKVSLYKSSEEEAYLLTGRNTLKEAAKEISKYGCKLVIITCGEKGSYYYTEEKSEKIKAYDVKAVDTTGAGDSFFAGVIYQIIQKGGIEKVMSEDLPQILKFANAAGALATTKKGGVTGSPLLQEVEEFIKQQNKE
ncbi:MULTISPECIES: carbohydrate kinase family protein [Mediterraneibacter]|uniref:carbohydrate kinase family protein n=1 Tax=Mediterraneibacter TaxID=2316020 RepID=UPI000E47CC38|nr:carbohydrate kinase [Mediterraneibacter massiliensis]RGT72042.1 carbohydrate kinase [Ruminococcus sp. AF18-22]